MVVKYDIYETPSPNEDDKEKKYHARVVPINTVSTDDLAKDISRSSSLTRGDVKAALISLAECLQLRLGNGERVHLEGIGFFEMTVTSSSIENPKKVNGKMIEFKSVAFRPEKQLKQSFKYVSFERVKHKKHSKKVSDKTIEDRLHEYFETNKFMTRADFETLFSLTRTTANRKIRALVNAGKLINEGTKQSPIYVIPDAQ